MRLGAAVGACTHCIFVNHHEHLPWLYHGDGCVGWLPGVLEPHHLEAMGVDTRGFGCEVLRNVGKPAQLLLLGTGTGSIGSMVFRV